MQIVPPSLDLRTLAQFFAEHPDPASLYATLLDRLSAPDDAAVWIERSSRASVEAQLAAAVARKSAGVAQPLYAVPFAVKDNIDVAGTNTTAACPDFAYKAAKSSPVVERLCAAGAICLGKTNLDQFACGLVGVRSPYGACRNAFNPSYISGGSSSGSAVAVASGLVSFSLGTDTAGSGRVPAAFNNIVGLKPTRGMLSAGGVVPACRSLDCVSIFALTCEDADTVMRIATGFDPADPFSRRIDDLPSTKAPNPSALRIGVPLPNQLKFFGDASSEAQFSQAMERFTKLGHRVERIDYEPFLKAAQLLYNGPWVAERLAAIKDFFTRSPDSLLPVTRQIICAARDHDAASAFEGLYALQSLRKAADEQWKKMDVMLLPTAPTIYTIAQIEADPIRLNSNLGYYTNFVNLMDLSALAIPSGFLKNSLPFGVTLIAKAGQDSLLVQIGTTYQLATGLSLGATNAPLPPTPERLPVMDNNMIKVAVVGAHLAGQPLNHQLTTPGGKLVRSCKTAPVYALYALPNTTPAKPGMVRVPTGGAAIALEVWELSAEAFGKFVASIPSPMVIGTIDLEDGERAKGFLCEPHAIAGARDITSLGGWRAFLASN